MKQRILFTLNLFVLSLGTLSCSPELPENNWTQIPHLQDTIYGNEWNLASREEVSQGVIKIWFRKPESHQSFLVYAQCQDLKVALKAQANKEQEVTQKSDSELLWAQDSDLSKLICQAP